MNNGPRFPWLPTLYILGALAFTIASKAMLDQGNVVACLATQAFVWGLGGRGLWEFGKWREQNKP